MKNLFLRMMALAIISTLIITGCGAVNPKQPADTATTTATAEQAQPIDTATTTATAEQAQPVDTATTTATAEQAAPAQADTADADSVIIVFDDGVEVVAVKDGDVYRCTSSNGHTFKYEGEEIAPGRYLISDEAVKSWAGLLLYDRKVNGW